MTKEEYEENLKENLRKLVVKLKQKEYKPKPARRVEIPKDNGKTRPLSIYCYEDKLVQEALREILEAVFEPHFYEEMMGFRPNRGCHDALKKLDKMLGAEPTNYVLDADIKSFFNHLDHEWIIKFIGSRIQDPNIIRLVRRMLKAGIVEDYVYEETTEGSGQGSVCSPIIANIYMHYVLVWWFHEVMKPRMKEYCGLVVYADDFVVCFKSKEDAEVFYECLKRRMKHFGLELEEEKSRLIEFGRFAQERANKRGTKAETFTFLGFTHYCSVSRNGKYQVKRKTSSKKFSKKCREVRKTIKNSKAIKAQLQYIRRDMRYIDEFLSDGDVKLSECHSERLDTIRTLVEQQQYMYDNKVHSVPDRIVSISQPYIRPIVRGKAKASVEFGAKLDLSIDEKGIARLERLSFDAYNESDVMISAIERYKERNGHYPERVLVDQIYRNRNNRAYCKEHGIRMSGPALGRPKKNDQIDKKQEYIDNTDRIEVERAFSLAKRKYGLGLITTKLDETTRGSIVLSILAMNVNRFTVILFTHFLISIFSRNNWRIIPQKFIFNNPYENVRSC